MFSFHILVCLSAFTTASRKCSDGYPADCLTQGCPRCADLGMHEKNATDPTAICGFDKYADTYATCGVQDYKMCCIDVSPSGANTGHVNSAVKDMEAMALVEGDCKLVMEQGATCITSPNYPENYFKEQDCLFVAQTAGIYSATDFHTEGTHDRLNIGCVTFMGDAADASRIGGGGPVDIPVKAGYQLQWTSDGSVTYGGWKICGVDNVAFLQADSLHGPCTVDSDNCWLSPNYPSDYANGQHCSIDVNADTDINATTFKTEYTHDYLTISTGLCYEYTGSEGPTSLHLVAGEMIHWHSDYSVQYSGWKICEDSTIPHTYAPSATPAPAPGATTVGALTLQEGPCTVAQESGRVCMMSPNYPSEYDVDQDCLFSAGDAGTLTAIDFITEGTHDRFAVGCKVYMGDTTDASRPGGGGPQNVAVKSGWKLEWTSDGSVTYGGWKICANGYAAFLQEDSKNGPCTVSGNCYQSPNYPANYDNSQECDIDINVDTTINAETFVTEYTHDYLTISSSICREFSGDTGPAAIHVHTGEILHWHSDYSVQYAGWKICEDHVGAGLLEVASTSNDTSTSSEAAKANKAAAAQKTAKQKLAALVEMDKRNGHLPKKKKKKSLMRRAKKEPRHGRYTTEITTEEVKMQEDTTGSSTQPQKEAITTEITTGSTMRYQREVKPHIAKTKTLMRRAQKSQKA